MNTQSTYLHRNLGRNTPRDMSRGLYDALRMEILRGRWEVGERIPSYKDLAAQTGLTQRPIQRALSRLEDEGYIYRIRHKGIFVKTTVSPSNESLGDVLVLVPAEVQLREGFDSLSIETQGFGRLNVTRVIEEAEKLGLRVQSIALTPDADVLEFEKEFLDSKQLFGIISLLPARETERLGINFELCPVIYLGSDDPCARPCLTGDSFLAALRVTQQLLDLGHRRLSIVPDPHLHRGCESAIHAGITEAMRQAGLYVDLDVISLDGAAPLQVSPGVTAALCFTIDMAQETIRRAEAAGISVPGDLSVASLQLGSMVPGDDSKEVMGAYYRWDMILTKCFDILLAPEQFKEQSISALVFEPFIDCFDSVQKIPQVGSTINPPNTSLFRRKHD